MTWPPGPRGPQPGAPPRAIPARAPRGRRRAGAERCRWADRLSWRAADGRARPGAGASCPPRTDRDEPLAPRVELALVEGTGDARAARAERVLAAVPGADGRARFGNRRAVARVRVERVIPGRARCTPPLAPARPVIEPSLADEPLGRLGGRFVLRRQVEAVDDEKPVVREKPPCLRDRRCAVRVLEQMSERIVRGDDEVELLVERNRAHVRTDERERRILVAEQRPRDVDADDLAQRVVLHERAPDATRAAAQIQDATRREAAGQPSPFGAVVTPPHLRGAERRYGAVVRLDRGAVVAGDVHGRAIRAPAVPGQRALEPRHRETSRHGRLGDNRVMPLPPLGAAPEPPASHPGRRRGSARGGEPLPARIPPPPRLT